MAHRRTSVKHLIRYPRLYTALAFLVLLSTCLATVAFADEQPNDEESEESVWEGVETLFVESQRRTMDLQDAAESISSFSAEDLRTKGIANFSDLQFSVPNLFVGGGASKTTLRGVGSEIIGPGVDPGFAVHVNGVYSARSGTGNNDYFDIQRIDVLRGPQGTLWGRNSTGGALNIITHRPIHELDAEMDIEYESFTEGAEGVRMRGMLNVPIVDDELAVRVAFLAYFNDGLTLNQSATADQRVNDAESLSLRLSLRSQPNENLTIDFIGTVLDSGGAGQAPKFAGPFFSPGRVIEAGIGPGSNYTGALPNPSNPYRGTSDERNDSEAKVYTATLRVDWEGTNVQLQSITGYQSTDFTTHRDQDGSSLSISVLDLEDKSRQVSQEFLLHSSWEKPLNYTIGGIYQYDWTPRTSVNIDNIQNTAISPNFNLVSNLFANVVDGCGFLMLGGCPPVKPVGVSKDDFVRAFSRVDNQVLGVYANVSWEMIEDLKLSAGGRYSYTHRKWDDRSVVQSFVATNPTSGIHVLQLGQKQNDSWESGTWKVTIDYRLADTHLLWASAGTGARAGGFNFVDENSFDQERIFAVEAGFKSSFLDNRLTLNATGFWYDWEDPQIRGTADNLPITTNAPSAESYGIELEGRFAVTPNLFVNASFGWLEATYDRPFFDLERTLPNFGAPFNNRLTSVNIEGNRLPRSARFNVSVGAQYTHEIFDWGTITPRVDFYYRSETSFRQFDNPLDEQPAYTRTDARITWRSPGEELWLELFMRNIENEHVKTNQDIFDNIYRLHYYDAPRSGGIRLGFDY